MKHLHVPCRSLLLLGLVALQFSCSAPQHKAPARPEAPAADAGPDAPAAGKVAFVCEPSAAEIRIDGKSVGTAAALVARGGLSLPFGLHRFEIAHPGYQTFRLELSIKEKPEVIRVKLQPAP